MAKKRTGVDFLFGDNALTSGHHFSEEEYGLRLNYILFNLLLLFDALLLMIAAAMRFAEQNRFQGMTDTVFVLVLMVSFSLLRVSRKYFYPIVYFVITFSYLIASYSFWAGTNPLAGVSWYIILLMVTFFIIGYGQSLVLYLVSLVTILAISISSGKYSITEVILGITPFFASYFFMYFFYRRNQHFKEIVEEQKSHYEYRARHDMLTRLPNREHFFEHFEQMRKTAIQQERKIAILYVDLDRFKKLNDEFGHHVGDEMLIGVSERLRSVLSPGDIVGRLGGDEFAILLEDTAGLEYAHKVIEAMFAVVEKPLITQEHILFPTFSMGCSVFPDDGLTEAELLRKADAAMYRAKKDTRRKYCFFDSRHAS